MKSEKYYQEYIFGVDTHQRANGRPFIHQEGIVCCGLIGE
jgi:hypothetical protein